VLEARSGGSVIEGRGAPFLEALDPLVAGPSADVELATEVREVDVGLQGPQYEVMTKRHSIGFLPGHGWFSQAPDLALCVLPQP
jgi:hypothetical protein